MVETTNPELVRLAKLRFASFFVSEHNDWANSICDNKESNHGGWHAFLVIEGYKKKEGKASTKEV